MNSKQFKIKVKEMKDFLKGKEITLSLMNNNECKLFHFKSLKAFGTMILDLEKKGAGFSFVHVENSLVQRRFISEMEINKYMNRGVWTKVKIHASIN